MSAVEISEVQRKQYRDEGYFILEAVIRHEQLEMLRAECHRFIGLIDAEMDALGVDTMGIIHRNNRYFIANRHGESERLHEFLFSDLMAEICRATLGDEAYLFHEQYVVKAAEKGMKFGWHQDSGYVGFDHKPYLTCWCPLDDVDENNGTVYLLPYSRAGTRDWVLHAQEEGSNDLIGYRGDDPGIPVVAPAGSVAVFSSTVFHRSGPNLSPQMRRVYLPQYSSEPIMRPDGEQKGLAIPFLHRGERVGQAAEAGAAS
jgi:ectoine hydroxylase-related dioxygenase (phytanoyl-CoA dioxygenase family)